MKMIKIMTHRGKKAKLLARSGGSEKSRWGESLTGLKVAAMMTGRNQTPRAGKTSLVSTGVEGRAAAAGGLELWVVEVALDTAAGRMAGTAAAAAAEEPCMR